MPALQQAQEAGLGAKQEQAFGDILSGARQRGLGFAGIPLGEQAKYTATTYLPALANLKQSFNERGTSLADALNGLNLQQNQYAHSLRESELNRDEQIRQFNASLKAQREAQAAASRAAAAAAASPTFGGGGGDSGSGFPSGMTPRADKFGSFTGFNFSVGNKPVSAARYATANKIPLGTLLQQMANSGDTHAARAYNWVKSIQGSSLWNSGKWMQTPAYRNTFSALTWGT